MAALKACVAALLLALSLPSASLSCSKEEYMAKFGAEYTLHGSPEANVPYLSEGSQSIHATVTYESVCAGGGSAFEANKVEKEDVDIQVFVLKRLAESCGEADRLPTPASVTTQIAAKIDTAIDPTSMTFVAFPPDQEFELFILNERAGVQPPADATVQLGASGEPVGDKVNDTDAQLGVDLESVGLAAGAVEASA
mmetsp:Transcript_24623/g.58481  ORF Transcript_24623/g.58481 Transcript_24623/m.58481 type:complete len:196 (-) Transcript_24623:43-630(-)